MIELEGIWRFVQNNSGVILIGTSIIGAIYAARSRYYQIRQMKRMDAYERQDRRASGATGHYRSDYDYDDDHDEDRDNP